MVVGLGRTCHFMSRHVTISSRRLRRHRDIESTDFIGDDARMERPLWLLG
jgi:hypothetical protein